ncbi:MAG TPA: ATP-binding protein [Bacteroidales bacterium]|jgi:hypothetical protein|nr:ATP-binding protein [Bacteroidales bacterium]
MKKPSTPFPLTGYYGSEYFCDREDETRMLVTNIKGGVSTILTAERRMGKTSLIMHVLNKRSLGAKAVYLDILSTESRNDFLNELATSLIRNASGSKGFGKKLWDFIKTLRPVIKFDDLTGTPQVSFLPDSESADERVRSILNFLEKQDEKIVIAIDEFQQILNYPEPNTDAMLRTIIQRMKNLVFIFSGSQQHLMNELFTLPSRPFYNSSAFLKIGRIEQSKYTGFIMDKFSEAEIGISAVTVSKILQWADIHTYYVQLLCSRLFLSGSHEITETLWKQEASKLLLEQEPVFYNYRGMLTNPQWHLLKAAGREGEVFEPTSSEFINKNNLGAPATVLRSLKSLMKMELIHYDFTPEGRKYYKINDLLFRRWVEMKE